MCQEETLVGAPSASDRCALPMLTGEGRELHGEILREPTRLVEAGKIMPQLDHRHFTLATVCDAYRAIKTGPVAGKIVVDVDLLALTGE